MAQLDSRFAGSAFAAATFVLFLTACDDDAQGSGGDAGNPDASAGWVEPGFRAYLEGDTIMLEVRHPESLWYMTCSNEFTFLAMDGDMTGPLRDDRRHTGDDGFYLNGKFLYGEGVFCDQIYCSAFDQTQAIGRALVYAETERKPPPKSSPSTAETVSVIETRPVSGTLTVVVKYSKTDSCEHLHEARLELNVPAHGVCCPVGREECNAGGPAGGWAPNLDACAPFHGFTDTYFRHVPDAHDCPVLVADDSVCCNCDGGVNADADAGS